jgi:hypothetical protein
MILVADDAFGTWEPYEVPVTFPSLLGKHSPRTVTTSYRFSDILQKKLIPSMKKIEGRRKTATIPLSMIVLDFSPIRCRL